MCKRMERSDDEGTSRSPLSSSILFCKLSGISILFEVLAVLEMAESSSECGCLKEEKEGNERN